MNLIDFIKTALIIHAFVVLYSGYRYLVRYEDLDEKLRAKIKHLIYFNIINIFIMTTMLVLKDAI